MGILGEVLQAVGTVAVKVAEEVVKAGYQVGKTTGEGVVKGTVKGTAMLAKHILDKATGGK